MLQAAEQLLAWQPRAEGLRTGTESPAGQKAIVAVPVTMNVVREALVLHFFSGPHSTRQLLVGADLIVVKMRPHDKLRGRPRHQLDQTYWLRHVVEDAAGDADVNRLGLSTEVLDSVTAIERASIEPKELLCHETLEKRLLVRLDCPHMAGSGPFSHIAVPSLQ